MSLLYIYCLLETVRSDPYLFFVDACAKIGYWSGLLSSRPGMTDRVVAIDAPPRLLNRLTEHCELNNGDLRCLPGILWSVSCETLTLCDYAQRSGAATVPDLIPKGGDASDSRYEICSVGHDDLLKLGLLPDRCNLIVTLDIGAAEIPAPLGARELLKGAVTVIIYEDHGSDSTHRVSRFMFESLRWMVYCRDAFSCQVLPVRSTADVFERTQNAYTGYNFIACESHSWVVPLLERRSKSCRS